MKNVKNVYIAIGVSIFIKMPNLFNIPEEYVIKIRKKTFKIGNIARVGGT